MQIAQIFVGTNSLVSDVHGMKFKSQFPNAFMEIIREWGAPTKPLSDSAKEQTSAKVKEILQHLCMPSWKSEPYHQHQNLAERRCAFIKETVNQIMDCTGSPPELWSCTVKCVCHLSNHTSHDSLDEHPLRSPHWFCP